MEESDNLESDKKEEKVSTGFDRGINFKEIKKKLIKEYVKTYHAIDNLDPDDRCFYTKKKKLITRLIYLMIAMIQLKNGSRISEAVDAYLKIMKENDFEKRILVKIAKSKTTKYKKFSREKFETKTRFRKMEFPANWFKIKYLNQIKKILKDKSIKQLKKCVLSYLLRNFDCNTHSLRYAFINFMLYDQKKEMGLVAKHVGHSNINQLLRYTQDHEADKLFDIDI